MSQVPMLHALLFPSNQKDYEPGHFSVHWEDQDSLHYRGYWPVETEIPEECSEGEKLRQYLFDHSVLGRITDDATYVSKRKTASKLTKTWPLPGEGTAAELAELCRTGAIGLYSYNPYASGREADNCVTWGTRRIRKFAGESTLQYVKDGRIKHMVSQFKGEPFPEQNPHPDSPDGVHYQSI